MKDQSFKKISLGYLYFNDPSVSFPKPIRSTVALIFGSIWLVLSLVCFFSLLISISSLIKFQNQPLGTGLSWLAFGVLLLFYLLHHGFKSRRPWKYLTELRRNDNISAREINIAEYFEPQTKKLLADALTQKMREGFELALFLSILHTSQGQNFLKHLELDPNKVKRELLKKIRAFAKDYELSQEPVQKSFERVTQKAFIEALELGAESIKIYHLLMALFHKPHPVIEDLLLRHNIELEDARQMAHWLRIKNDLVLKTDRPRRIKHKTMNRAYTAKPTKFLDAFSADLTDLARHGTLGALIGHEEEYEAMVNILNQEARNNVLLLGVPGSGRQAIINELARQITLDKVPKNLYDQRLVSLSAGDLLAGLKTPGALQERLQKIMDEIIASKNIVLAIPQIHDLIRAVENQALSFMSFFGPVFESVDFPLIASTDEGNYHNLIEKRGDLASAFNLVKVKAMEREDAIKFLMREALILETKEKITIGHFAIKEAIDLSERFIKNRPLPGKALDFLTQAVEEAKLKAKDYLSREDVRLSIGKATGIPVERVSQAEGKQLLRLEQKLHERLIDQEQAVQAVAQALRQARAGLEKRNSPIGTFLFVGPTGVGKTELAKALAEIYFGGEEKMLRFDMSEYQSQDSIYRLIGNKDHGGFLTEKVKNQSFALILLDEFEKAHADVLNLFLQIFDDGRATDELGNVVDFSNTIIIATSNAHAAWIQQEIEKGKKLDDLQQELRNKLIDIYRPELLNRFDDIIVFKTLNLQELEQIAQLKTKALFTRIEDEQAVKFSLAKSALNRIAELGYNPKNGARPLDRAIAKYIKNLIANATLAGKLKKGEKYLIEFKGESFLIKQKQD